jgi:WXG100 family type VII secretion target
MTEKIEAKYDQLETVAQKFNREQEKVENTLQTVRNCVEGLRNGGWIGRGAEAFFSEMQDHLLPGVDRLKLALEESSQVTKQIAIVLEQAEEEASNKFRHGAL